MGSPWRRNRDRTALPAHRKPSRAPSRLDPTLFEAHHYFGHTCIEAGDYERAAEQFEAAAAARPDDYQALVFARQAYRSLGRAADERSAAARQVAAAERALRADPTDARALSLSTGSLVVLGRIDEARAWTQRSRELEPDEPYVHYNAACALAQLGQVEEALDRARERHGVRPPLPAVVGRARRGPCIAARQSALRGATRQDARR